MGSILLYGWLRSGMDAQFIIRDPNFNMEAFTPAHRASFIINPDDATLKSLAPRLVVVAIKPQVAADVLPQYALLLPSDTPIMSIMAGKKLDQLAKWMGNERLYIRIMSNICAAIGQAMSVAIVSDGSRPPEIVQLMQRVGKFLWLDTEDHMDVCTTLCGSGTANVFELVQRMIDDGIQLGLTHEFAQFLTYQTVASAGMMFLAIGDDITFIRKLDSTR